MATEVVTTPDEATSPTPPPPPPSSKKRKQVLPELEVDLEQPEPPSKKARRALKKGKPLPTAASSRSKAAAAKDDADLLDEEDEASTDDPKKKKKKKTKKGEPGSEGGGGAEEVHGVWIGNLPFTVTRPELFKWLVDSSGGTITEASITRVNLPTSKNNNMARDHQGGGRRPATPPNKGFAYVDFATYEASVAAMALSETELGGRKVLIKNSKSFEGRPTKQQAQQQQADADETSPNNNTTTATAATASDHHSARKSAGTTPTERKIFVGNLSFATTEDDVWAHFDKCGPIDWVKVATFEDTGKCKGYGWVKFREATAAASAVQGFVKIREDVVTEADFVEPEPEPEPANGDADGDADGADEKNKKEKNTARKTKMRKWWVNTLQGRTLKIQLAEDDQVRYKKRFGKDAGARRGGKAGRAPPETASSVGHDTPATATTD